MRWRVCGGVTAQVQLQHSPVGDDIAFGPAWRLPTVSTAVSPGATSRDTTVCSRMMIRGEHHRVDGVLGHGAVSAAPIHGDLHAVGPVRNGPGRVPTVPRCPAAHAGPARRRGRGCAAAGRHRPCPGTVAGLLGGLEQGDQDTVPLAVVIGQELGRTQQAGHVESWPQAWPPAPRGRPHPGRSRCSHTPRRCPPGQAEHPCQPAAAPWARRR